MLASACKRDPGFGPVYGVLTRRWSLSSFENDLKNESRSVVMGSTYSKMCMIRLTKSAAACQELIVLVSLTQVTTSGRVAEAAAVSYNNQLFSLRVSATSYSLSAC